jgi:class 3 adenylate cyclase
MKEQSTHQAVVFADVCGSTTLYEALGDQRAFECIALCLDILRRAAENHHGRVVKTIGDELMCVFTEAEAAARAAGEMQSRIALQAPVAGKRLAVRIGAHYGPTLERSGDLYGDAVNVASRMANLANEGQIMTTRAIVERLPPDLLKMTRSRDSVSMKGKQGEIAVYELLTTGHEEVTAIVSHPVRTISHVRLHHGGRETILEGERRIVKLGRDPASDIVIADRMASRHHARVERRRDKCVLVDVSSNGTFVTFHGQPEISLRREEVVLRGSGTISFGHSHADDPTEVVAFDAG